MSYGPKHKTNFKPGQRLNGFVLLRNFRRVRPSGATEWLWECLCDCGTVFNSRENMLLRRYGCHSCTNATNQRNLSIEKYGIEQYGVKRRIYREYKRGAKMRNLPFELTFEQFLDITSRNCEYCGAEPVVNSGNVQYMQKLSEPWKHNGIDRIDTKKGYTVDNCVACCSTCNYAKHDLSVDEFKRWVYDIYHNMFLERSTTIPDGSTGKCPEMENSVSRDKDADEDIVSTEKQSNTVE